MKINLTEKIHLCEHENCFSKGDPYSIDLQSGKLTQYYCMDHAKEHGYCAACHLYFGGMECFDSNDSKLFCDECLDELNHELGIPEEGDYAHPDYFVGGMTDDE